MTLEERIIAFTHLGSRIDEALKIGRPEFERAVRQATAANPWFTEENVGHAFEGMLHLLEPHKLHTWLGHYALPHEISPKHVGLVLAGNIPLVGFHDLLCVLVTGNIGHIKASAQDQVLPKFVVDLLIEIEPRFASQVRWYDHLLSGFSHVIATGSNNTSRYFESYFGKFPHIIRKNRNSVAVLDGNESLTDLHLLGRDIFRFFGLGCRNVSKVYLPAGYDPARLIDGLEGWKNIILHHKYRNNYDYQKAILLVERLPHLDNGFLLLRESASVASPVATLHYSFYHSTAELHAELEAQAQLIQCVVGGHRTGRFQHVPFGRAQLPEPWDYADGVDTVAFLIG